MVLTWLKKIKNNKVSKFKEISQKVKSKDLLTFIKKIDDALLNVIIVGHNPPFSEVSQKLSSDNAPALRTSCWTQLTFQTNKWSSIENGTSISGSRKSLNV